MSTDMESMLAQAVHVHVDNAKEISDGVQVVRTEEREPEHFVCSTVVVPQPSAGVGGGQTNVNATQVCYLNLLRKSIAIQAIDSPVVLVDTYCHRRAGEVRRARARG